MPLTRMRNLEQEAETFATPCGDGSMIWRRWGSGEPVVLLHGGSGSWNHWIANIPVLKQRYEVWAIDIPGLGDSAMPSPPINPQSCADAVALGFKHLFSPQRKARMVGFSFGCHVGTLAAADINDHLHSLTIIGCAALGNGRHDTAPFPKERTTMTAEERREVHRGVLEILMISKPERIGDEAIELQAINVGKARFRSRQFADSEDIKNGLANVTVPLRTIWGRNDIVAYPDVDAAIRILALHHPEIVHRIVDDAGHWVMYEQADAFNAALLEILEI